MHTRYCIIQKLYIQLIFPLLRNHKNMEDYQKMIGEDAKPEKKLRDVTYTGRFDRLRAAGNAFNLAETVATEERPLLNQGYNLAERSDSGLTVFTFSKVSMSRNKELILGVGSSENGWFYQVPVLQLATGVDVAVSGTIDRKGEATRFEESRRLSDYVKEKHNFDMTGANRVYGVALVPNSEALGDELLVCGYGDGFSRPVFQMAANGFMLNGVVGSGNRMIPLMHPDADGDERCLKISDVLSDEKVAGLEEKGVYPGLTVIGGRFAEHSPVISNFDYGSGLLGSGTLRGGSHTFGGAMKGGGTLGAPTRGAQSSGRVGIEVGGKTDVRYGSISGRWTGIDGVLALHFVAVSENTTPEEVRSHLDKLL